ncbi:MAG TPA: YkuS family protein [Syntrophomonadaceae bacterium]|nr:YkuS family protein [Syntrophomonadaceae bacterium]
MAFVAVEEGLGNVQKALKEAGYQVVGLEPGNLERARIVVISGVDSNMMQQQDIGTTAPVINAAGQSAQEIVEAVRERLS